jgi:hypothetical protein
MDKSRLNDLKEKSARKGIVMRSVEEKKRDDLE